MFISTMARQEIRVMSTRRGYEVPLLPTSVGENSCLLYIIYLSIYILLSIFKKNDENITNFVMVYLQLSARSKP